MKKKLLFIVTILSVLMIGLVGCLNPDNSKNTSSTSQSSSKNNTDNNGKVLKVGVVGPFSGAGAGWGLPLRYGVEMAVKEVNEKGGLNIGGTKYNIQVVAYDDKYVSDEAVSAANRLVFEDKVNFIFGTVGTAGVLAMQNITEKNNVLLMPASYAKGILSPDKPLTFRWLPTNMEFGKPMVSYLKKKYPDKMKVAFISPNDESGWQVQKVAGKNFTDQGYKIITNEFPERNTQDYNPILTKVLNTKPDIIAFGGTAPGEMSVAMNQARALGFDGLFTAFGGPAIKEILKVTGKNAEGFVYYAALDFNADVVQNLIKKYGQEYSAEYLEISPEWYDGAKGLFSAMEKAGSLEPKKVADTLRGTDSFQGLFGKMIWTGSESYGINQQIIKPIVIGQVVNGKPKIVDTINVEK